MSSARLPLIDAKGDIYLHGQEDLQLLVTFADEDTTNAVMFMIIEKVGRIPVVFDAATPTQRKIVVPQATIAQIPAGGANYALRDETETPNFVRLDGKIRWYGWAS